MNLAFEVPGQLVERPVDVGTEVKKDQMLARLDPRDYQNALDATKARRTQAEAFRDRIAEAAKTGAVAQQQLTDAQAQYDVAVADVKIKEKALADTRIYAPFAGTIAATFVENFQNVRAKQPALRLLDTSKIEMTLDIPESLISNAPYVKEVKVEFDAFKGRPVSARIKEIGTEATLATRTYPVTLVMDQPQDFKILPGMAGVARGHAELPGDAAKTGFEVPVVALYEHEGQDHVWVLVDGTTGGVFTARRRAVQAGELTGRGVLLRGVQPGEIVATAGVHYLREGQKVRLLGESGEGSK